MGPETIGVFIPIIALVGFFGLMGLKTWSAHQLKMRETEDGDSERLPEAVQQLHDDVGAMREEITELQERVDFTERLLSDVRSKNEIGPGDSG